MKQFLGVLAVWVVVSGMVFAYETVETVVAEPYDVVTIQADESAKQMHLGTLEGYPVMYEFSSAQPFALSLQVSTVVGHIPDDMKLSLMVVRENDDQTGVTEVARLVGDKVEWRVRKDAVYGLTLLEGETLYREYEPGVYRVEVSTPVNEGEYLLSVGGTSDSLGYFAKVGQVRTIQKHFGYSVVRMLTSSYVYYPLGIMLLLIIFHRTWKWRKSIANAT